MRAVAAVCGGVARRKEELSPVEHRISDISEQQVPLPTEPVFFFLRSAAIAINKPSLKDKQFGPIRLSHRPAFRAH